MVRCEQCDGYGQYCDCEDDTYVRWRNIEDQDCWAVLFDDIVTLATVDEDDSDS